MQTLTEAEIDFLLERFDQTDPAIQRGVVAAFVAEAEAGERFKAFVHAYLDSHNVPHGDPENEHQREGCRIGARLDLLFAQRDAAVAHCNKLRCFGCGVRWTPANDKETCDAAHEATWGHEWVIDRVESLTQRLLDVTAERDRLFAAVREHHGQQADDRCVEDDAKLYAAAGLPSADVRVGDKAAMLKNCERFIERRCEGGGWPTYAQLEAERDAAVAEDAALRELVQRFAAVLRHKEILPPMLPGVQERMEAECKAALTSPGPGETLLSRLHALEAAARPFAEYADKVPGRPNEMEVVVFWEGESQGDDEPTVRCVHPPTVGDCRRLRDALRGGAGREGGAS